jgi:hypothetical protein
MALLDAPAASKAEPLASEFLEFLALIDYQQYYDAMPTATVRCGGGVMVWGQSTTASCCPSLATCRRLAPPR